MSERTLDDRLFDALHRLYAEPVSAGPIAEDVRLAISTALTLARRETAMGLMERPLYIPAGYTHEAAVNERWPLPTRIVRKVREESDPEREMDFQFRFNEDSGEVQCLRKGYTMALPNATRARIALWYDLMQRPYHEEQAPVDPNEVLP